MKRTEYLNRRLAIAIREAEDADRVWRQTMELPVAVEDERQVALAARRLHAVWQEREWALARVEEVRRMADPQRARLSRFARMQRGVAHMRWHAARRLSNVPSPR